MGYSVCIAGIDRHYAIAQVITSSLYILNYMKSNEKKKKHLVLTITGITMALALTVMAYAAPDTQSPQTQGPQVQSPQVQSTQPAADPHAHGAHGDNHNKHATDPQNQSQPQTQTQPQQQPQHQDDHQDNIYNAIRAMMQPGANRVTTTPVPAQTPVAVAVTVTPPDAQKPTIPLAASAPRKDIIYQVMQKFIPTDPYIEKGFRPATTYVLYAISAIVALSGLILIIRRPAFIARLLISLLSFS